MSDDPPLTDGVGVSDGERWLLASSFVLFTVVYLLYIRGGTFRSHDRLIGTLFDDALISLRYAQHLVGGHGLVWNIGEQPPVEGYTDLGWTLVMAIVALVSSYDTAPIGVSLVGAATLLFSGVVTQSLLREIGASRRARLAGTLLVLASYPTVFWTLRGMEVGALALLLLVALRLALVDPDRQRQFARQVLISTAAGLALLVRNDAVLMFLPVIAYVASRQRRVAPPVVALLPLLACTVGQVLFRYFYYADLAPNTYVLKMTGVATGTRLAAGAIALVDTLPVIAPAIALAAVGAFATRVPALVRDCSRLALGTLVIQWVYLVWIGGDAWLINYSNRFIAAILPTLLVAAVAATPTCLDVLRQSKTATVRFVAGDVLLLAALGLRHPHAFVSGPQWLLLAGWLLLLAVATVQMMPLPAGRWSANAATVTALALFLASSAHGWLAWSLYRAPKAADDIAFARLGLMLRERLPDDAVIASAWVGAPAYFSQLRSLDLLGKTDAHVARVAPTGVFRPGHNKMDLAYSVGLLRPDVVLLDNPAIATYGYRRLPNGLWLRPGSSGRFDVDLRASWCTAASESVYCPNMQLAAR